MRYKTGDVVRIKYNTNWEEDWCDMGPGYTEEMSQMQGMDIRLEGKDGDIWQAGPFFWLMEWFEPISNDNLFNA